MAAGSQSSGPMLKMPSAPPVFHLMAKPVHAETCGQQMALEHNGDVYSCDHYVEPGYLLGNITQKRLLDLVALPQQWAFGQDKRDTLTQF